MQSTAKAMLASLLLSGFACQHRFQVQEPQARLTDMPLAAKEENERPEAKSSEQLQGWLYYNSLVSKMNARDLKIEFEQQRRSFEQSQAWEDELRLGLVQTAQQLNGRSFQKALETFEPLLQNAHYSPNLRLWLSQYKEQLQMSAQLEKELYQQKKERSELEAKLKALSNIELEMSQRQKNDPVR